MGGIYLIVCAHDARDAAHRLTVPAPAMNDGVGAGGLPATGPRNPQNGPGIVPGGIRERMPVSRGTPASSLSPVVVSALLWA